MGPLACIQVFWSIFSPNTSQLVGPRLVSAPKCIFMAKWGPIGPIVLGLIVLRSSKAPNEGPVGPKIMSNGSVSMYSSVFHPFSMKQANWLVMAPKGLFMAKWGPFGAIGGPNWGSFRDKLLSNGSSNMHSSVVFPYFIKHKPTGWFKTREADLPNLKMVISQNWPSQIAGNFIQL